MNRVPSEEDFLKARALMRERDRGLSEVRSKILERFSGDGLHEAFFFFSRNSNAFIGRMFFRWSRQLEKIEDERYVENIRSAVVEELHKVGRGVPEEMRVLLDFDSHENVESKFGGDYSKALR